MNESKTPQISPECDPNMSENDADNSENDIEIINNFANMRNLARPNSHWVVTLSDIANETEEVTESDVFSVVTSDSDCLMLAPAKRKLVYDSSDSSSAANEEGTSKKLRRQIPVCPSPAEGGNSSHDERLEQTWLALPQPLVVEIMLYLDKKSRLNMALTCKSWSHFLSSAVLWRSLNIELSSFQTITKPMVQYCKSHARHFNRVTISWRRPSYILSSSIHSGLNRIFCHLKTHSQVQVFRMHYMELDRYWRYEKRREKLICSLAKFLDVQRKLKTFVMNSAQTEMTHGCRILEGLARHSGDKIETLNLEDFFQSRVAAFRVNQYINVINKFTNVKQLYLNYNYLSDEIVERLAVNNQLQILSVKVYKNDPHYHKISTVSWAKLKRANPKMEVNFEFDQVPSYIEIKPILVQAVPLRGLYIWSGYEEDEDWRIGDMLKYISKNFAKTLESFTLEIENDSESIDTALLDMACSCKALYHLDVNAILCTATVEQLCKLQAEGKISLQSLYITIAGATDSGTQDRLDEISTRYSRLTEAYHLDFQFTADVIIPSEIHYIPIAEEQFQAERRP